MIFSPTCSSPLALHEGVCPEEVVGAVFIQRKKVSSRTRSTAEHLHHGTMKSKLYFMDKKQVSQENRFLQYCILVVLVHPFGCNPLQHLLTKSSGFFFFRKAES